MQTFLPLRLFYLTAKVLDRKRLSNQRKETNQILANLVGKDQGWQHHPAVKMWRGYENALLQYQACICHWSYRTFGNHTSHWEEALSLLDKRFIFEVDYMKKEVRMPPWIGDREFHISHQANLVRKKPEHYKQLFPLADPAMKYRWPVLLKDGTYLLQKGSKNEQRKTRP